MAAALVAFSFGSESSGSLLFESDPGLEGLGAYTGELDWSWTGGGTGVLTIDLTNTSPLANGGYLTGFAFNTGPGVSVSLSSGMPGWSGLAGADAHPFPVFDWGAAIDGDFLGGGSPVDGIAVGGTERFTFDVAGDAAFLASLTDAFFFAEGTGGHGFIARFRGFLDEGSDKVTASVVPAPGSAALLGLAGLSGLAARRRR